MANLLVSSTQSIGGLLNAFTGGAFANASVFALGIMPYISASIVVQLMQIAVPYLQKLQKEGESGRRKINQITRWLTIAICLVQAPSYLAGLPAMGVPSDAFVIGQTPMFYISSVIILVTGTIFAVVVRKQPTKELVMNINPNYGWYNRNFTIVLTQEFLLYLNQMADC